jgi:hypothetical protein
MQGVHAFDPKATVSIDLESFVAADHSRGASIGYSIFRSCENCRILGTQSI